MTKKRSPEAWKEAKKRCRLNNDDIQMAKELGLNPRSLIKNIPSPQQKWKAPVKQWVREIYFEKFGKVIDSNPNKGTKRVSSEWIDDEDLPF